MSGVLGTQIKALMVALNCKQKDLAEAMGVSVDRVKNILRGRAGNLTREEGESLIRKLNVRAEWLATGTGPMFRSDSEQELQRRLDAMADSTERAALEGLTQDEQARVQSILLGLELRKVDLVRKALEQLDVKEHKLIDWYRSTDEKGKKAIETTAKALARSANQGGNAK